MIEFAFVIFLTLGTVIVLFLIGRKAELVLRRIESFLTYLSAAIILFVMTYVLAEVLMRYAFNSPLPGHLEGAELLLPMIVFLAVSYTQARNGHVGMSLLIDLLPADTRRITDICTLTLSALTCAVLAYFGAKQALFSWQIDDVTMTPPYWPIWPSAAVVPLGYLFLAIRMSLQALQRAVPERFPKPLVDDPESTSIV
ncbi:uncharacterized protein METZ01_LOCUS344338 [marine metagenome]|uniref:Tripartite ATP-independent periplasmic transporters DctQ component domain-containing protein n=1 Tax=marine metagenome TaxID=408172 RepID=A0A382R176_9ZZZZ